MRPLSWKWIRRGTIAGLVIALAAPHAFAAWQYRAAVRDLDRYHPESARHRLRDCISVWPKSGSARLLAARAAREAGDLEDAYRQLHLARQISGESTDDITFEWALLQASAGNFRETDAFGFALPAFLNKQVDLRPAEKQLVWEALAEGYLHNYRTVDAMSVLERWLDESPDNVRALELRGRTFITGKGVKRGSDDLRRVLELDPERDDARRRFTRALLDLGAYSEAVPHLELLMRSHPDDPDVPVRLARCLNMLNRKEEARRMLEAAIEKQPENGLALRTLGQFTLSDANGRPAEAEAYLRRAAQLLPDDYQSQWLLYESVRQQGKPDAAALLKAAEAVRDRSERIGELQSRRLAEQPLEPALHVEMAGLLMQSGKSDLALSWLRSALALDAGFRPAHRMLAEHFEKVGSPDLAAQHRRLAEE